MMTEELGQVFMGMSNQVEYRIQKQEYPLSIRKSDWLEMDQRFLAGLLDKGCYIPR